MHFLILGGTGPSGIELIRKALETDSTVVVYARSPQKIPEDLTNNASVTIIEGTLEELDKVDEALDKVDAVISALGPVLGHPAGNPIAIFYGHLIDLLHKHNIKRFLPISTASQHDSNDTRSLFWKSMVWGVYTFARTAYLEIIAIGEVVTTKGADLDWTLVRVPILTNGDTEATIPGYVGDGKTGTMLSRKAYAAFCIAEVEKKEWMKKSPFLTNA